MEQFEFFNPVHIYFGQGIRKRLGSTLKRNYKKVLVVCSEGPFHKNGLYDEICTDLTRNGLHFFAMEDIASNPKLASTRRGTQICIENDVDCIVALGGGSTMDCAKTIGAAAKMRIDPYDLIWGKRITPQGSIDTVMIPTLAATGSEANPSAVIVNDETSEKYFFRSVHPVMAFMDPEILRSVPYRLAVWGAMDILSHTFEYYFNGNENSEFQKRYSEAIIFATMHAVEMLNRDPHDINACGELMWCATSAWGIGLNGIGRGDPDMGCHGIEESFSGYFDTHHGACLAVLTPRWMELVYQSNAAIFARFGRVIFGISEKDDLCAAKLGIEKYKSWMKSIGVPNTYFDIGSLSFTDEELLHVAKTACRIYNGGVGRIKRLDETEVFNLLKAGKVSY